MIGDALNAGLIGIQRGLDGLRRDARTIAGQTASPPDAPRQTALTDALVGLRQDQQQAAAGARVVRAVDETLGTLLDLRA